MSRSNTFSFKQFLLEDDENIVFGLRRVAAILSDIKTNWRSDYSSARTEQQKFWKKLPPQRQSMLKRQFNLMLGTAFQNIDKPVDISGLNPTSKAEAQFIYLSFRRLAKDIQDQIGPNFLQLVSSGPEPVISREQAQQFKNDYNTGGVPKARNLEAAEKQFITSHGQQLIKLIFKEDTALIGLDIDEVSQGLEKAIRQTPKDRQAEAVGYVHYFLLKQARNFADVCSVLEKQYAGKKLPEQPPKPGTPTSPSIAAPAQSESRP